MNKSTLIKCAYGAMAYMVLIIYCIAMLSEITVDFYMGLLVLVFIIPALTWAFALAKWADTKGRVIKKIDMSLVE